MWIQITILKIKKKNSIVNSNFISITNKLISRVHFVASVWPCWGHFELTKLIRPDFPFRTTTENDSAKFVGVKFSFISLLTVMQFSFSFFPQYLITTSQYLCSYSALKGSLHWRGHWTTSWQFSFLLKFRKNVEWIN